MTSIIHENNSSESHIFYKNNWPKLKQAIESVFNKHNCSYSLQQIHQIVFQFCRLNCGCKLFHDLSRLFSKQAEVICDKLLTTTSTTTTATWKEFMVLFAREWFNFEKCLREVDQLLSHFNCYYLQPVHNLSTFKLGESLFCSQNMEHLILQKLSNQYVSISVHHDERLTTLSLYSRSVHHILNGYYSKKWFDNTYISEVKTILRKKSEEECCVLEVLPYLQWSNALLVCEVDKSKALLMEEQCSELYNALCEVLFRDKCEYILYSASGVEAITYQKQIDKLGQILHFVVHVLDEDAIVNATTRAAKKVINLAQCNTLYIEKCSYNTKELTSTVEYIRQINSLLTKLSVNATQSLERAIRDKIISSHYICDDIAKYIDTKFKETEIDDVKTFCVSVVTLIRYVVDKDACEVALRNRLAERLLWYKQCNLNAELTLIRELKKEYGSTFVSKMMHMFEDFNKSAKLQKLFVKFLHDQEQQIPFNLHMRVLTTGVWPYITNSVFTLTDELQVCAEKFKKYYLQRHNGRKLSIIPQLGEVIYSFEHDNKVFDIVAQTSYAHIINVLNYDKPTNIKQFASEYKLSLLEMEEQLSALERVNLIRRDYKTFWFNNSFSYGKKVIRVDNNQITQHKERLQRSSIEVSHNNLHTSRVDALLVHFLKQHRSASTELLLKLLNEKFNATELLTINVVKQRLEYLVEKGFVNRSNIHGVFYYNE